LRAQEHVAQENADGAISEYELALAGSNTSAQAADRQILRHNLAMLYIEHERYSEAAPLLEELYAHDPTDEGLKAALASVHLRLAQDATQTGDHDAAVRGYRRAQQLRPSETTAYQIGRCYAEQERYDEALAEWAAIRQGSMYFASVLDYRAQRLRELAKSALDAGTAIEHYEALIALSPTDYDARLRLAQAYAVEGRIDDACREYTRLVDERPDRHVLNIEIALLHQDQQQWDRALARLDKIPQTSSAFSVAESLTRAVHIRRAIESESAGDVHGALAAYTRARSHGGSHSDLDMKISQLLYETGDMEEAAAKLRSVLDADPGNELAHFYLGLIEARRASGSTVRQAARKSLQVEESMAMVVRALCEEHRVSLPLVVALIRQESNFDPRADTGKAYGLMQLTPNTARAQGLIVNERTDERSNPARNVEAGTQYLRHLLDLFDNNEADAIVAYNLGPTRFKRNQGRPEDWPVETQRHLVRVWHFQSLYSQSPEALEDALRQLSMRCKGLLPLVRSSRIEEVPMPDPPGIDYFRRVSALPEALFNAAVLYEAAGAYASAAQSYQDYLGASETTRSELAVLRLASCRIHTGEYAAARRLLESTNDRRAQELKGLAVLLTDGAMEAIKYLPQRGVLTAAARMKTSDMDGARAALEGLPDRDTHMEAVLDYFDELSESAARMRSKSLYVVHGARVYQTRGTFVWPLSGPVTSPFGPRRDPITGRRGTPHTGIDIGTPVGTPVRAARAGRVVSAGSMGTAGKSVILEHDDGYRTHYYHLDKVVTYAGDSVRQGGLIGLSGRSGRATGPHLHFSITRDDADVDPLPLLLGTDRKPPQRM
jgi:tetratricopeptide (TPR) repeat protein